MTRKKRSPGAPLVRSSAAEYLTFVAASGGGGVEAIYADENVWLSQKMMAQLYDVEVPTINYHLKKVFEDSELEEDSVVRNFRIAAADGKTYDTKHYNLSAIIAVGYKVNSERAVQFRKWATRVVEEFTIKGFAMDDERLERGGSVLSDRYFEEQLQRVREIRLSERKFYQKITDIYATSVDYDVTAQATKRFFATVQNKLHWAIHGQTAAEVIVERADVAKPCMGLTSWKNSPKGPIRKTAAAIAIRIAVVLVVALALGCAAGPPAGEDTPRAALARLGACLDRRDTKCIFPELDRDSRWSVETIHRSLVEARELVERSYPEPARAGAFGVWSEAARAGAPAECFAVLAAERGWTASLAAGFGAAAEVREAGPDAVEVLTTRGAGLPFIRHDGRFGLALWSAELQQDKLRVLDNLQQIRNNAREFDEQRAALAGAPQDRK
jgi:hypothetical protein